MQIKKKDVGGVFHVGGIEAVVLHVHFLSLISVVKNLPANTGDTRDKASLPGLGRSPGEGNGNPLQYSCPDRGAWRATVHGVAKSRTWLSMHARLMISK